MDEPQNEIGDKMNELWDKIYEAIMQSDLSQLYVISVMDIMTFELKQKALGDRNHIWRNK